tara:strand:+ start:215 stop:589 length:375 start_codon:yes stop_codon:yes gene_type:complete
MQYKREEIKNYIIDNISYLNGIHTDDIHYELFNIDHYLIGYYNCEKWLIDGELNWTFEIINYIITYEQDNFGKVSTNFGSSEDVVNMYVYIIGEQILNEINIYNYDCVLTKKDINNIIKDIKEL